MILRLSELPEERRIQYIRNYEDMLDKGMNGVKFLKPYTDFDEYGLKFPVEYLNDLGKYLIFFPLEYMADYCDIVTKNMMDGEGQRSLFNMIEAEFNINENYNQLNATAIGNMAYILLNCKDKKISEILEKRLNDIFVKTKGVLLNELNEIL